VQNREKELKENRQELKALLEKYEADEKTKECINDENTIEKSVDYVLTREIGHNRQAWHGIIIKEKKAGFMPAFRLKRYI
jgi:hypothetical protein